MSVFRIRRTVRLLPGALLSASATHAGGSWRDRPALSGRELLRTLPPVGEPESGQSGGASGTPPRRAPRKQPVTAVPLLAGAVLVLWLLLALSGHH